jgi:lysophospholipase L1-like esterase
VSDFYTIPPNSRFRIIIANNADPTTDISEDTASEINSAVFIGNEQLAELVNPKNPVRWCAMGDSITEGYYSYIDSENESQSAINRKLTWVPTVSRINKWELTNKGVGGTGWLKKENSAEDDHNTAYYIARHTNYTAFDLVTLAYGINDWKANEQMGTLSDDSSAVTPTTVIQAMKATIEAILSSNPSVKVIGILPLNCAGYDKNYGTKATNWGLGYSFSNTGTLNEFVEALVSVYEYYGIQYVDMAHYSCVNRENLLQALPDGVHPSLEIHKVLASELSKKITF